MSTSEIHRVTPAYDQEAMETKGVASYRSPVTTLGLYADSSQPQITHEAFVEAVSAEFGKVYQRGNTPLEQHSFNEDDAEEKVWKGVTELKSWEWTYGSTPEFSYRFSRSLPNHREIVSARPRDRRWSLTTEYLRDFSTCSHHPPRAYSLWRRLRTTRSP